jgi:hypothetical protein
MIRETPRSFPLFYQIQILLGGIYTSLGLGMLIFSGISYLIFREKLDSDTLLFATFSASFVGIILLGFNIVKNYEKIRLLTWGIVLFGKLKSKDQGYRVMTGNYNFECEIIYQYRLRKYSQTLQIQEAYEMEEGDFFILIIDEEQPQRLVCLEQFSESFREFFKRRYSYSIREAERKLDRSN